ncbi:MAG: hypothetical protein A4E60_02097 [Syntrophorhabdus sp. PtaB.Bin047]|jgi:predicted DNA-binding protein (UPF0251 family)|nr:MAG: hypothetical protein A4E60_02097 [Syntrophorhabdus sp. PtaB.Bin047]
MSRPKKCRCVCCKLESDYFKPRGTPLTDLDEVSLKMDELEALRLADVEGLYQEEAARQMNISRATFGRIVEAAHRKVADAILHGKALKIESEAATGGTI